MSLVWMKLNLIILNKILNFSLINNLFMFLTKLNLFNK